VIEALSSLPGGQARSSGAGPAPGAGR